MTRLVAVDNDWAFVCFDTRGCLRKIVMGMRVKIVTSFFGNSGMQNQITMVRMLF
jgi:hypothetical protein